MQRRIGTAIRGPGAILVLFALAAGLTAIGNRAFATASPKAAVSSGPRFYLAFEPASYRDSHTGVHIRLGSVGLEYGTTGSYLARSRSMLLHVQVRITNGSRHTVYFDTRNFAAVDPSGQGYAGTVPAPVGAFTALGAGRLARTTSKTGWIAFIVPNAPSRYLIIWNDDNHLIPPAEWAHIGVRRVTRRPSVP